MRTLPYCDPISSNGLERPDKTNPDYNVATIPIEELLSKKIGLEVESIGRGRIASIVGTHMDFNKIDDTDKYLHLLESSPEELDRLINDITVPETWFFRDIESFRYLKKYVKDFILSALHRGDIFRVLSVPSSTGEEPYSIAITLLEAGLLPEHFRIDAMDINQKSIDAAKKALYGKGSFRGEKQDYKEKYFSRLEKGFELYPVIAELVNFYRGNFTKSEVLPDQRPYHVIFCKNLLIYLTDEARKKVFGNIDRLLLRNGILFTGHAEILSFLQYGYSPEKHVRSFACRKKEPEAEERLVAFKPGKKETHLNGVIFQTKTAPTGSLFPRFPVANKSLHQKDTAEKKVVLKQIKEAETLSAIRRLADGGSLDEALSACGHFLIEHKHNKEAYYLMGLINLALNIFDEAEIFFQKVLYLDPGHYEALIHMKLLHEKKGDHAKASVMEARIKRFNTHTDKAPA